MVCLRFSRCSRTSWMASSCLSRRFEMLITGKQAIGASARNLYRPETLSTPRDTPPEKPRISAAAFSLYLIESAPS